MKSHQIALLCHAGQVQIVIDDKFHADLHFLITFQQVNGWSVATRNIEETETEECF